MFLGQLANRSCVGRIRVIGDAEAARARNHSETETPNEWKKGSTPMRTSCSVTSNTDRPRRCGQDVAMRSITPSARLYCRSKIIVAMELGVVFAQERASQNLPRQNYAAPATSTS